VVPQVVVWSRRIRHLPIARLIIDDIEENVKFAKQAVG
jgi:hypothetical protein